jgi:hypothetical protein
MHAFLSGAAVLVFFSTLPLAAQVVPTSPRKFDTKRIGDAVSGDSTVTVTSPRVQAAARTITHIVLGEPRQWKLSDGTSFLGKLIAFEDIEGNAAAAPVVPKNPTVVRDGKARMLVNSKSFEVALERLGTDERKLIEEMRGAFAAKK